MKHPERFIRADAISDRLIDVWRSEVDKDTPPMEILMGALLGLMALITTMPAMEKPPAIRTLIAAVQNCLEDLLDYFDRDKV